MTNKVECERCHTLYILGERHACFVTDGEVRSKPMRDKLDAYCSADTRPSNERAAAPAVEHYDTEWGGDNGPAVEGGKVNDFADDPRTPHISRTNWSGPLGNGAVEDAPRPSVQTRGAMQDAQGNVHTYPLGLTTSEAGEDATPRTPRVLFQSAVSGLFYEKLEAAGDISAIRVGERIFHIEQAGEDAPRDGGGPYSNGWDTYCGTDYPGEDATPRTSTNHVTCLCDSCRNATPRTPLRDLAEKWIADATPPSPLEYRADRYEQGVDDARMECGEQLLAALRSATPQPHTPLRRCPVCLSADIIESGVEVFQWECVQCHTKFTNEAAHPQGED